MCWLPFYHCFLPTQNKAHRIEKIWLKLWNSVHNHWECLFYSIILWLPNQNLFSFHLCAGKKINAIFMDRIFDTSEVTMHVWDQFFKTLIVSLITTLVLFLDPEDGIHKRYVKHSINKLRVFPLHRWKGYRFSCLPFGVDFLVFIFGPGVESPIHCSQVGRLLVSFFSYTLSGNISKETHRHQ